MPAVYGGLNANSLGLKMDDDHDDDGGGGDYGGGDGG